MRIILLTMALMLASSALLAAEFGDAYIKLFNVQMQLANTGHPGAQYSIGEMYEQGMGTPTDMNKAYEWYEKAAKQGDVRAKHKLETRERRQDALREQAQARETDAAPKRAPTPPAKPSVAEIEKMRAAAEAMLKKQKKRSEQNDVGW